MAEIDPASHAARPDATPPGEARVVVIGGGVVGCSILYHLALRGWRDCVLVEKNELTSGSTWHAAGNCARYATSPAILSILAASHDLYAELDDGADTAVGRSACGSIRLAHSRARLQEFAHIAGVARRFGIELAELTPGEIQDRAPHMEIHGVEGGLWDPHEAHVDPSRLTQALAKGARDLGQRIVRFCRVLGVRRSFDGWTVVTEGGEIRCQLIVNAAGCQAAHIAEMFRAETAYPRRTLPVSVLEHQYLVTDEMPALADAPTPLPIIRDPDLGFEVRQDHGALLLSPADREARLRWRGGEDPEPDDFSFQLFPDDLGRLEGSIADICERLPIFASADIARVICGPLPYSPDGAPLIGPTPGVSDAFEACAFSAGVSQAGGAGQLLANWMVDGEPGRDVWAVDPRRFADVATRHYAAARAAETYPRQMAIPLPHLRGGAGRPGKTSRLHDAFRARSAVFGDIGGWERALWFARDGDPIDPPSSFERPRWQAVVGEECRHVSEHVGVADLCGLSRFEVSGRGAGAWLRRQITGPLPSVGRIGLVYFASPQARLITQMTATRFSEDHFWLIGSPEALWRDHDLLRARLPIDGGLRLSDLSGAWSAVLVTGPTSRELMARLSVDDVSPHGFPWLSHRLCEIGMAQGVAIRISCAGELGWELHFPTEHIGAVYARLWAAAAGAVALRDIGALALESMRLEKGYRAWGAEVMSDFSPLEAGLDQWVRIAKGDFIGRAALAAQAAAGVPRAAATLLLDPVADDEQADIGIDAARDALVLDGDRVVGRVTSGGFGHRTGRSIALAVIERPLATVGIELTVDVFGGRRRAIVAARAVYDPTDALLHS